MLEMIEKDAGGCGDVDRIDLIGHRDSPELVAEIDQGRVEAGGFVAEHQDQSSGPSDLVQREGVLVEDGSGGLKPYRVA